MTQLPGHRSPGPIGLYDPANEHDACGVAFVGDMHGRRSRDIVDKAITALLNLEHRGGRHLREAYLAFKPGEMQDPEQVPALRDGQHLLPERYPYALLQRDELISMMVDYLLLRGSAGDTTALS